MDSGDQMYGSTGGGMGVGGVMEVHIGLYIRWMNTGNNWR
jgi:hypothetical protein